MRIIILIVLCYAALCQEAGNQKPENHPSLTTLLCEGNKQVHSCKQKDTNIVLDANWRWLHTTSGYTNCYTGSSWDKNLCPDPTTCSKNCALDGADYQGTYGINAANDQLNLKFVTRHQYGTNVGSRVYLMDSKYTYQMFYLKNKEFSFDVDVSKLPCGINGALYFVEMDKSGNAVGDNKAGANFGTGYCDAQCPHDIKFINGKANVIDWDEKTKTGRFGSCCSEIDIWEANSISNAYTAHPCNSTGLEMCEGSSCERICDQPGCDFNPFRMGDQKYYGGVVDVKQKFTVITQFITSDNTDRGDLVEIRRMYAQNGKLIPNSKSSITGMKQFDSLTDEFCDSQKDAFKDKNVFKSKGGMKQMGKSLERGHVLVMSLWDDTKANMLWLDSNYPIDAPSTQPGVSRGTCPTSSGKPEDVERDHPDASVTFSNIRFGNIDTTY